MHDRNDSLRSVIPVSRGQFLAVSVPCIVCALFVIFLAGEKLLWQFSASYPPVLTGIRYVDDIRYLTPDAIREICANTHTTPVIEQKQNGIFLRCGTPGIEGVWQIKTYVKDDLY